jgi:hypothetical protein
MSGVFRVRNWSKFQHYSDRNPPWIKLHFELLSSQDWVTLDDASRVLAITCMLIASRNGGEVPANPGYLKRVAYLNKTPNFKPLIDCGFLESASTMLVDASTMLADARPETETETETEGAKAPTVRGSKRCPEDFIPDRAYAIKEIPDLDYEREAQKFKDWEFKTARKDWPACWRTWIGNARDRKQYAKGSSKALPPGVKGWI